MNINRAIITGRLTKDIEVRKTTSGLSVASFTVAVDRMKTRDNQEPGADFLSCTAWRQTADFLGSYARKGNMVAVEGRISTRSFDGQDGRKVYVTEIVADNVQLLTPKSENRSDFQIAAEQVEQAQTQTKSARRNGAPTLNGEPIRTEDAFGNYDDTLPSINPDELPFY